MIPLRDRPSRSQLPPTAQLMLLDGTRCSTLNPAVLAAPLDTQYAKWPFVFVQQCFSTLLCGINRLNWLNLAKQAKQAKEAFNELRN